MSLKNLLNKATDVVNECAKVATDFIDEQKARYDAETALTAATEHRDELFLELGKCEFFGPVNGRTKETIKNELNAAIAVVKECEQDFDDLFSEAETIFCSNCGKEYPAGTCFCKECGNKLE